VILAVIYQKFGLRPEQFAKAYLAEQLSLMLQLYVQMTDRTGVWCVTVFRSSVDA